MSLLLFFFILLSDLQLQTDWFPRYAIRALSLISVLIEIEQVDFLSGQFYQSKLCQLSHGDNVFNELSQANLENHPRWGQSRIDRQTIIPSTQKSPKVCARLECRICDPRPPSTESDEYTRRSGTRGSRVSLSFKSSNPQEWETAIGSRSDSSQRFHSETTNKIQRSSTVPFHLTPKRFMISLDIESAFFHVGIAPSHRKYFASHLKITACVKGIFIPLQPGGYWYFRLDNNPASPSITTPKHLHHCYYQVIEWSHYTLALGWTASPRIWADVMNIVN